MSKRQPSGDPGNGPWTAEAMEVLTAAKKPRYWLLVSEEEAQAIAGGVLCARTIMQAVKLCETLGGLG